MKRCVYCKRCHIKGNNVSFHRFPDDDRKHVWLKNMKALDWKPNKYNVLCSNHFEDSCFIMHFNRKELKKESVPTIFDSAFIAPSSRIQCGEIAQTQSSKCDNDANVTQLQHTVSPERSTSPKLRITSDSLLTANIEMRKDTSTISQESSVPHLKRKIENTISQERLNREIHENVRHDHQYDRSPRTSKIVELRAKQALKHSQAHVKVLRQQVKRLKSTVSLLKSVIDDFLI